MLLQCTRWINLSRIPCHSEHMCCGRYNVADRDGVVAWFNPPHACDMQQADQHARVEQRIMSNGAKGSSTSTSSCTGKVLINGNTKAVKPSCRRRHTVTDAQAQTHTRIPNSTHARTSTHQSFRKVVPLVSTSDTACLQPPSNCSVTTADAPGTNPAALPKSNNQRVALFAGIPLLETKPSTTASPVTVPVLVTFTA